MGGFRPSVIILEQTVVLYGELGDDVLGHEEMETLQMFFLLWMYLLYTPNDHKHY